MSVIARGVPLYIEVKRCSCFAMLLFGTMQLAFITLKSSALDLFHVTLVTVHKNAVDIIMNNYKQLMIS